VRERIETSGRDARWEFNKGTLFARSSYMAEVCGHLSEMVEIVDDFFKFLGPELKVVTGACVDLTRDRLADGLHVRGCGLRMHKQGQQAAQ
jgi:dynein heavy chain